MYEDKELTTYLITYIDKTTLIIEADDIHEAIAFAAQHNTVLSIKEIENNPSPIEG
jgi:hypothetical protein